MIGKNYFTGKSFAEYISLIAGVCTIITLFYYYGYENSMKTVNVKILVLIGLAAVCNIVYFIVDYEGIFDIGILEIAASIFITLALSFFILDSWSSLADLLNGIQIFSGGRGSISAIRNIAIFLLVVDFIEIAVCFMKKKR